MNISKLKMIAASMFFFTDYFYSFCREDFSERKSISNVTRFQIQSQFQNLQCSAVLCRVDTV